MSLLGGGMVCSGSKMPKNTFFYIWLPHPPIWLPHPPFKAHYCYKINIKFIFPLTLSSFMPIYKCLLATSNFIQDTFNLKAKKTHQFSLIFCNFREKKIDGGFHGNRLTNRKKNILTFCTQLYFKHIETCIITIWNIF